MVRRMTDKPAMAGLSVSGNCISRQSPKRKNAHGLHSR
jgi:hypothetical protein